MNNMRSEDLCARIAVRFAAPEYATAFEVRNSTGYTGQPRYADAVAFSLFPSRGLTIHGMEVKVARSDWVKELKTPHKAEAIAKHCDFWTLVVSDKDIVKEGELPPTWGLMIPDPKSKSLRTVKAASELSTNYKKDINRGFVFSLLRNFTERYTPNKLVDKIVAERAATSGDYQLASAKRGEENANEATKKLIDQIETFKKKTGIDIGVGQWDFESHCDVASKLIWILRNGGPEKLIEQFEYTAKNVAHLHENIQKQLSVIRTGIKSSNPWKSAPTKEGLYWIKSKTELVMNRPVTVQRDHEREGTMDDDPPEYKVSIYEEWFTLDRAIMDFKIDGWHGPIAAPEIKEVIPVVVSKDDEKEIEI